MVNSKLQNLDRGVTFSDVLIQPKYSEVMPEDIQFETKLSKNLNIGIPLLSAAMDTVTEVQMANTLSKFGSYGVLHRNNTIEEQSLMVKEVIAEGGKSIAAVGFYGDAKDRAKSLVDSGVDAIVVDTAHGDSKSMIDFVKNLKSDSSFSKVDIIAGNIATKEAAKHLIDAGADALKVGIGPGSICTTRIVTGVGIPQLTAISHVSSIANEFGIPVIADGGIEYSGDLAKAIIAGASSIMLGSLLAATSDSPGAVIESGEKRFKQYRGMGSMGVMSRKQSYSKDRYFQSESKVLVPEGIEGIVPYKGSTDDEINILLGGLRQSMFYVGAKTIDELQQNGEFIQISNAALTESHPHNLSDFSHTVNY